MLSTPHDVSKCCILSEAGHADDAFQPAPTPMLKLQLHTQPFVPIPILDVITVISNNKKEIKCIKPIHPNASEAVCHTGVTAGRFYLLTLQVPAIVMRRIRSSGRRGWRC